MLRGTQKEQLTVGLSKFDLKDRLEHGNLEVNEVCYLKPCSRSKFYQDRKAGLVETKKVGSKSVVRGPIAKKYISGEPIHPDALRGAIHPDALSDLLQPTA
jgi:hypothetical protein